MNASWKRIWQEIEGSFFVRNSAQKVLQCSQCNILFPLGGVPEMLYFTIHYNTSSETLFNVLQVSHLYT